MSLNKLGIGLLLGGLIFPLLAGPALTTIQDVIYNADGSPYNGFVMITWTPFEAGDTSKIATQSLTATISGGNLMVQLVPTTNALPAGYYRVTYTSAGNDQFTETWAVPPSTHSLRVRDVLQSSTAPPSSLVTGSAPIPETNVTGLTADLSARPIEGAGFAPGRLAFIDAAGALDAVAGNVTDCVHVDGSSGPCGSPGSGSSSPTFADGEVPAGLMDGVNPSFTINATPAPAGSLALYRNGILQKVGLDYNSSGNAIQFLAGSVPQPGDTLVAWYRVSAAGTLQGPPAPQVLCAGIGIPTSSTTLSALGTCTIPAGTLQPGDRVKISFDYSHEGALTGFVFAVNWGNTSLVQRTAAGAETLISGWGEAGAGSATCQLSVQTWGSQLGFAAGVSNAWDSMNSPIVVSFQGMMAATTLDTVTLRNFTVVRYPGVS